MKDVSKIFLSFFITGAILCVAIFAALQENYQFYFTIFIINTVGIGVGYIIYQNEKK